MENKEMRRRIYGAMLTLLMALLAGCRAVGEKTSEGLSSEQAESKTAPAQAEPSAPATQPPPSAADLAEQELFATSAPELWIVASDREGERDAPGGVMRTEFQGRKALLPLTHTDVKARISGFFAMVEVTQRFHNPHPTKIEAVYVFPLPYQAAVTDFIITIGERQIRGMVRDRKEAEMIYQAAKAQGYRAVLLSHRQPGVFTHNIANLEAGASTEVKIAYFSPLNYRDGECEFVFPLVALDSASALKGDTEGSEIRPQTRSGENISLTVLLHAGVRIEKIESPTHPILITEFSESDARVVLQAQKTIPNCDFVLRYRLTGREFKTALLIHRGSKGNGFALIVQPPEPSGEAGEPVISDVEISWGDMKVSEIYPREISEILPGHALIVTGRFTGKGWQTIHISGRFGGVHKNYHIAVDLNQSSDHPAIETLWAIWKMKDLFQEDMANPSPTLRDEIIATSIEYNILCPYTDFLIVDALEKTQEP